MPQGLQFLDPKTTLFLMCDLQNTFRDGMTLFSNLVKNAIKLTKAGKELDIPLMVAEHCPDRVGRTISNVDISHARLIIAKTQFSMLVPELDFKMREIYDQKPNAVVLYGLETHIDIEQTAMDMLERDISVFIVADCCGSRLTQDRDLAFARLRAAGCVIATIESLIFNLLRDNLNPKFALVRQMLSTTSHDMQLATFTSSSTN